MLLWVLSIKSVTLGVLDQIAALSLIVAGDSNFARPSDTDWTFLYNSNFNKIPQTVVREAQNIIFVVVSSMYVRPSEKTSFKGGLFQM